MKISRTSKKSIDEEYYDVKSLFGFFFFPYSIEYLLDNNNSYRHDIPELIYYQCVYDSQDNEKAELKQEN